jgi:hypothetical protein
MSCCDKPKVFEKKNGKVLHEFNCSNCSGYITVKLDEDLNGAHCVVCPSCKHEHYRIIKDGVISEDRAPTNAKSYAIRICPTKAAYSKTSWESEMAKRKSNTKDEGAKHFLNDAWKKVTGKQIQTPPQKETIVEVKKPEPIVEVKKPEPIKVDQDEITIFDELLIFCGERKTIKVKAEDYAFAAKWLQLEKKIKAMKEALKNGNAA